ncbi:hypothetical protein GRS96_19590 (plasmid) [Rathayibacter sp. VKM Ac-2803]|uniref:DUF7882 domain-containing protein n=1 Tax=Rathayibacter caricis DSM 15933 TaxID=1328867 RepID=A0A2T4UP50_9MICO|nr:MULTISPECIES: hypothetical protein [Rathayibacter]MWV51472.1 hypothetical protein [Rathayibacter sp. VKM Ac-2803]PTL71297.1 hypothetical protein C1I63_18915 [Rathayibacter caricis DSM 15933]
MGVLIFGAWRRRIEFDDRTLSHVQTAIRTRMTLGAPFRLAWRTRQEAEYRSYAILVHPNTPLEYRFDDPQLVVLNRLWLRELLSPALGRDMVVIDEPGRPRRSNDDDRIG